MTKNGKPPRFSGQIQSFDYSRGQGTIVLEDQQVAVITSQNLREAGHDRSLVRKTNLVGVPVQCSVIACDSGFKVGKLYELNFHRVKRA